MRARTLTILLSALGALTVGALALAALPWPARLLAMAATAVAYGAIAVALRRRLRRRERLLEALTDGLASLHDRDYSMSIGEPEGDGPLRRLVAAYNGLGARLRSQRQDLYQRELLLDTVIQASPLALVLTNQNGVILYANLAARQLLGGGRKLEGLAFAGLIEALPPAMREALARLRE